MSGSLDKIGAYEEYKARENVVVPEGFYAARITGIEDKVSKSGDEHLFLTFTILDPAYIGAVATDRWYVYGGSDGAFKRAKIMVNKARKATEQLEAKEASEFLNFMVAIKVTTNTYNDKSSNQVDDIMDLKDHPELLEKSKTFKDDIPF